MINKYLNLFKPIGYFLVLYIYNYLITFILYYSANNYDNLINKYDNFSLIEDILAYLPTIIFTVFSITYIIKKKKLLFITKNKKIKLKHILLSLSLIYCFSFIFNPFYHNFNMKNIPLFKLNIYVKTVFLIEILDLIIIPIFEELFFRDLLLKLFNKLIFGIIITSLLYSISHFYFISGEFSLNYLLAIKYFIFGIILSILRLKYDLVYAIIAHIFYNTLIYLFNSKIINLYLLDYIKSNTLYWCVYSFFILYIIYTVYNFFKNTINKPHLSSNTLIK